MELKPHPTTKGLQYANTDTLLETLNWLHGEDKYTLGYYASYYDEICTEQASNGYIYTCFSCNAYGRWVEATQKGNIMDIYELKGVYDV